MYVTAYLDFIPNLCIETTFNFFVTQIDAHMIREQSKKLSDNPKMTCTRVGSSGKQFATGERSTSKDADVRVQLVPQCYGEIRDHRALSGDDQRLQRRQ